MKALTLALILFSTPALAEIDPTLPPEGIRAEVLDSKTCSALHSNLMQHPRNVWFNKTVFNERWFKNSQGEYINFHCHHTETQYNPFRYNVIPIVLIADAATLKSYHEQELTAHKQGLRERQRQVKQSGLE